jgi:hypothetical protein
MRTVAQACGDLGVSWHTLKLWMGKLGIQATRHELDLRLYLIAEEDIERIRAARESIPRARGSRIIKPYAPVRVLEARQAALPAEGSVMPVQPSRPPQRPVSASEVPPVLQEPRGKAEPMPEGAMTFNQWCNDRGENRQTIERLIAENRMPAPLRDEVGWRFRPAGSAAKEIYTWELIAEADTLLAAWRAEVAEKARRQSERRGHLPS